MYYNLTIKSCLIGCSVASLVVAMMTPSETPPADTGKSLAIFITDIIIMGVPVDNMVTQKSPSSSKATRDSLKISQSAITEPKPGEEREIEIAKGVKMKFCWIPVGKAMLGSPKEEKGFPNEKEHEYESKGFWLGKYAVTQCEWAALMGKNPSSFCKDGDGKKEIEGKDTSRFPVERVSWDDCQDFIKKLNTQERLKKSLQVKGVFTLPCEDEWEYACRGGKGNNVPFYFGSALNGEKANCDGESPYGTETKGPNLERTCEVGSYEKLAPHPWGLCDMHGNVWQWCENKYEQKDMLRASRGGSWKNDATHCRSAHRAWGSPDYSNDLTGFRLCFRCSE